MKEDKNKNICFTKKFLIIFTIMLLIFSCVNTNNVFAATYDLSDYKNCSLVGGKYVIIYSYDNDKIYLLTLERADYPYIYTNKHSESTEDTVISTGGWISCNSPKIDYNAQGHIKYYTFNPETSKFENLKNGGIGNGAFNPGKSEIIASNTDVRMHNGTVFFRQTPVPSQVYINPNLMETQAKALGELIQTIIAKTTTIIPIGLVVLSIGLLIYVIKSVILRVT